jgi:hypothetical protein
MPADVMILPRLIGRAQMLRGDAVAYSALWTFSGSPAYGDMS